MNVLSLFDGMSCGQIALNRAGIKYKNYYASEIKKDAIKVTQHNFPNTIQLGDVTKWENWNLPKIDLLIAGSPCQDLSRAHSVRDGLNGQKSSLFYTMYDIYKSINPKKFLLENVIMDDENYRIISNLMGTEPVRINSSLVSAQLRDRLYWTNIGKFDIDLFGHRICKIPQPKNKNIKLQDILEDGYSDREKARAILARTGGRIKDQEKIWNRYKNTGFTTVVFKSRDLNHRSGLRYLRQIELERLQTIPEHYTKILNINQAENVIGDGWTADVIAHIFSFLF